MTEWVTLQSRFMRFAAYAVTFLPLAVAVLYARARPEDGAVLGIVCAWILFALVAMFSPAVPLVAVDLEGMLVLGLPWRRVSWSEVTSVYRHRGLWLNYIVVTTRSGEFWLTRREVMNLRTPDLDAELSTLTWYWNKGRGRTDDQASTDDRPARGAGSA